MRRALDFIGRHEDAICGFALMAGITAAGVALVWLGLRGAL